nr:RNA-dependent RNA polymerase, mitoviral [Tanacetum cinerariifolium]
MASFCVVPPPNYLVVCRTCVPVFTNYTVLEDDVVIADENVATRYKESIDLLRVVISKEKSLISRSGSAEFAKSFRVRDLTVDRSSVSIKALLNTFHPGLMAVAHRYSVCDLLCRLGGARYHVLARLNHRRPEAHGRLVRLLRAKLKPRELVLPPDELCETEESRDFREYSLLYGWMDAPGRIEELRQQASEKESLKGTEARVGQTLLDKSSMESSGGASTTGCGPVEMLPCRTRLRVVKGLLVTGRDILIRDYYVIPEDGVV